VIGTIERRPSIAAKDQPPRRPATAEGSSGMAAEIRQRP
jgi:hypothetical protein